MEIFNNFISFFKEKRKLLNSTKGIFIPLECKFRFSYKYCPCIYNAHRGKLLSICIEDVQWKDKFGTPRHEEDPFISICLFSRFYFNWIWKLPSKLKLNKVDELDYWEQFIWYKLYYKEYNCDKPNLKMAKKHWPWKDMENNSTWIDNFLTKESLNEIY